MIDHIRFLIETGANGSELVVGLILFTFIGLPVLTVVMVLAANFPPKNRE